MPAIAAQNHCKFAHHLLQRKLQAPIFPALINPRTDAYERKTAYNFYPYGHLDPVNGALSTAVIHPKRRRKVQEKYKINYRSCSFLTKIYAGSTHPHSPALDAKTPAESDRSLQTHSAAKWPARADCWPTQN